MRRKRRSLARKPEQLFPGRDGCNIAHGNDTERDRTH